MAEKCKMNNVFSVFLPFIIVFIGFFCNFAHKSLLKFSNMDKFIIITTPTIEGHLIKAYLGAINVNVVIGTNFFSDFAASFTDVIGDNSSTTYQRYGYY